MKLATIKLFPALILSLLLNTPTILSQSPQENRDMFSEAESYFVHEEFNDALPLYIQLNDILPENHNIEYKIGRCYLNIPYSKTKSVEFLEKASKFISVTSKENRFNETNAPIDALFYLGDAYRINNQLEKAIKTYELFKTKVNSADYDFALVDYQIASCKRAIEAEKKPVDIDDINIGPDINTRYSETNPVVSQDENTIVYAAQLPFYQAIFYAKKVNGKWTAPVNMIPELGIDDDCIPNSLSSDGTELYVYRSNEYLGDIFVTNFVDGKWTKLRKLNGNINTKYWESDACISSDGKTLYFSSNRPGGYGGLDIYKSTRTSGDNWGVPENLGPVINSEYNEDAPFVNPQETKIYFSSFGHNSIGGYDIFYAIKKNDGTWGTPVNLGYPVNTPDDELFFCPVRDGKIGYVSQYDPAGSGRYDIMRIQIFDNDNLRKYNIKGLVKLPEDGSGTSIPYTIALYDRVKKDTVFKKKSNNADFEFQTVYGKYDLIVSKPGSETNKTTINIPYGSKNTNQTLQAIELETKKLIAENKLPDSTSDAITKNKNSGKNKLKEQNTKDKTAASAIPSNEETITANAQISDVANNDSAKNQVESPADTVNAVKANSNKPAVTESGNKQSTGFFNDVIIKNKWIGISGISIVLLLAVFLIIRKRKKQTGNDEMS